MLGLQSILSLAAFGCIAAVNAGNTLLPTVDLGYELHQASVYNATGRFFNFSNIRYAAPPLGEFRFAAPQPPAINRSTVQTGSVDRICPQAAPAWELAAAEFLPAYYSGQTVFNDSILAEYEAVLAELTSAVASGSVSTSLLATQDPRITEDCLFLDVIVPENIFEKAKKGKGAPVLVWIFGGGYVAGSKVSSGDPAGLITRSQANNGEGVVYVAINYRLGAFGWLSGSTLQENGTANAGLHDQRMALEWVQKNIHLFGGDPSRVTVLGQSAGAGSIMHQITAFGGNKGPAPFAQAVLQSPGFQPIYSSSIEEDAFNTYLSLLNVSTIEQARKLPTLALQLANYIQIAISSYGFFAYGPSVDGNFVPALPGVLLSHGQYDKSVRVMVGHNADEGLEFTLPTVKNNSDFEAFVITFLPSLAGLPNTLGYIVDVLYPPIFNGSQAQGYTNQLARAVALISEVAFSCNTYYLDKAYPNQTYAYFFAVPPATHGQDIAYTFYNANDSSSSISAPQIAIAMQEYITRFAETGNPNEKGVPFFPMYGGNDTVQVLNVTGISQARDPVANARCDWWQKALYY